jgi:Holliday junction resolvasome RuvABC endonuclease subunit
MTAPGEENTRVLYIGIDPGKAGGIATLRIDGTVMNAIAMPPTERDLFDFLCLVAQAGPSRAMLERVHSSPQMGVVSAFTFGQGYGALRMVLTALQIPFDEVAPQKWQSAMAAQSGGDKNITKRRAQALFPFQKITHSIADALLLAEFARRFHNAIPINEGAIDGKAQTRSATKDRDTDGTQAGKATKSGPNRNPYKRRAWTA